MGRRLPGVDVPGVLKRSSISSSGDGPTSPGGVAVDRAGGGSGRWLSLSWWWACEARRGRSGRGSGRCSGLSVVRGRLRGLSWGNRPHFGADPREYLTGTYAASAAIAVRRHSRNDDERRDRSLIELLHAVRRQPELLTRARHVQLYKDVGMSADIADREFDRIAEPSVPHLMKPHVQRD